MKLNTPYKVNKQQYRRAEEQLKGIVAMREGEDGYWIKILLPGYGKLVKKIIGQLKYEQ